MKNTTINSPKFSNGFVCEKCHYICSKKGDYNKHLRSIKHNTTNTTKIQPSKLDHLCECGKLYNHRASLYNHKKKCSFIPIIDEPSPTEKHTSSTNEIDHASLTEKMIEDRIGHVKEPRIHECLYG
jgi:hypothetical protein